MSSANIIGILSTIAFLKRCEMYIYDSNIWMLLLTLIIALFFCYASTCRRVFFLGSDLRARAGNFSFHPRVPLRLTHCGAGAGRPFWKIQHAGAGAGRVDSTRGGCGAVDFESRVPANPQKNKKNKKNSKNNIYFHKKYIKYYKFRK